MRRVSQKLETEIEKTKRLIDQIDNGKKEFSLEVDDFSACTIAARKAAKEVGLKFTYGMLATGNNRNHCRYLYFPGKQSVWNTLIRETQVTQNTKGWHIPRV